MKDDNKRFGVECPNDWPMPHAVGYSSLFVAFVFLLAQIT